MAVARRTVVEASQEEGLGPPLRGVAVAEETEQLAPHLRWSPAAGVSGRRAGRHVWARWWVAPCASRSTSW